MIYASDPAHGLTDALRALCPGMTPDRARLLTSMVERFYRHGVSCGRFGPSPIPIHMETEARDRWISMWHMDVLLKLAVEIGASEGLLFGPVEQNLTFVPPTALFDREALWLSGE